MNCRVFCLVLIIILYALLSYADECAGKSCTSRTKVEVCFVDKTLQKKRSLFIIRGQCGHQSDIYYVGNKEEIEKKLSELAGECKKITKLTFSGHGSPGYHATGLRTGSMEFMKKYGCLLKKNNYIRLDGCDNGKGCRGDMFLHDIARNFFSHTKSGVISAPRGNASAYLPGILPHFSLNGSRKLTYDIDKEPPPPDRWDLSGIAIGNGGTMAEHCKEEIKGLVEDINSARSRIKPGTCESNIFHLGEKRIREYVQLGNSLSDNQSWNYGHVEEAIWRLENQLKTLRECSPPKTRRNREKGWQGSVQ